MLQPNSEHAYTSRPPGQGLTDTCCKVYQLVPTDSQDMQTEAAVWLDGLSFLAEDGNQAGWSTSKNAFLPNSNRTPACSAMNLKPLLMPSSKVSPSIGLKGFQVRSLPGKGPMVKPTTHANLHAAQV